MNNNYNELNALYKEIYELTDKLHVILSEKFSDEVTNLLVQRQTIIDNASKLLPITQYTVEQQKELSLIVKKTQELDLKNIDLIENQKTTSTTDIAKVTRNSKMINAYRYKQSIENLGGTDQGA